MKIFLIVVSVIFIYFLVKSFFESKRSLADCVVYGLILCYFILNILLAFGMVK